MLYLFTFPRAFHQEEDASLRELKDHITNVTSFSWSYQTATYHLS